ncbi:lysine biosynthesis protein LysW [Streptosporangium sp. CA-115845]|uniref:lysine biosynthesis protein LysW n=1 Tax=Streptosporangium sp. CA-115845 TaxID=3240071 RepID=UPI003D91FCAA
MGKCPECGASVALGNAPKPSEIFVCGECAVELELIAVGPPQLALAPEVEEDWGE